MEPHGKKLKLTKEQKEFLTDSLIAYGTDLLNDEESFDRNALVVMFLISQRNNAISFQHALEDKQKHGIKLNEETLSKLQEFMGKNRFSPLLGCGWKEESEVIGYLADFGLKFGKTFMDRLIEGYVEVTSSMPPEQFDNQKERKEKINKEFEKNEA